ncbi:hypothetical protein ISS40_10990 [Candidatus Bathyarchaeota archaeon]|nr:hypothetical protein [Candidatus Bathyarchaeota archaeon]
MDITKKDTEKEQEKTYEILNKLIRNMEKEQAYFAANLIKYINHIHIDVQRQQLIIIKNMTRHLERDHKDTTTILDFPELARQIAKNLTQTEQENKNITQKWIV